MGSSLCPVSLVYLPTFAQWCCIFQNRKLLSLQGARKLPSYQNLSPELYGTKVHLSPCWDAQPKLMMSLCPLVCPSWGVKRWECEDLMSVSCRGQKVSQTDRLGGSETQQLWAQSWLWTAKWMESSTAKVFCEYSLRAGSINRGMECL